MARLPLSRSISPLDVMRGELGSLLEGWPRWAIEGQASRGGWFPMDVVETQDAYVVTAEVPGVASDDVEVSLENNVLSIAVKKSLPPLAEGDSVHMRERAYGDFKRSITLPRDVDIEKVTADQRAGLLAIRLPKREEARPRQITIGSSGK